MEAKVAWDGKEYLVVYFIRIDWMGPTIYGLQGEKGTIRMKEVPESIRIAARAAAWRAMGEYHRDFLARVRALTSAIQADTESI